MSNVYPYIPNSVPEIKKEMLEELGLESVEDIYAEIPDNLRFKGELDIPEALSEYELERHVEKLLSKDKDCKRYLNFLGGGTWQHYVPEVCDTINQRDEFLTAYVGAAYADHGKYQAMFEYTSMLGDLLDLDVSSLPIFDWGVAAAYALRMASRLTGRNQVLVVGTIAPERRLTVENLLKPIIEILYLDYDKKTGLMDLEDLKGKLSEDVAAVYFENPSYLGFIESQGQEISDLVKEAGGISIVGVDPSSLGVMAPPVHYGADITCGDLQPLGIHMAAGSGLSGFIATRDEEDYVAEFPMQIWGLTETTQEGQHGFGDISFVRTSYASREKAKDFLGTQTALWGITAGVYLALMGPKGMEELGQGIMQRAAYLKELLLEIPGLKLGIEGLVFKEFILNFDETGKTVAQVNKALLEKEIFGGKDLSEEFPELGQSALYSVTEVHTKEDLDQLVQALKEVLV